MRATSRALSTLAALLLVAAVTAPALADDAPADAPPAIDAPADDAPADDASADDASAEEAAPPPAASVPPAPAGPVAPTKAAAPDVLPPAPVDIAAFPPRPPRTPEERGAGVEVHGFAATWWIPWSEDGPGAATDALRLRFAVLRVDARPAPRVSVLARLGLMLPGSPLLDLAATYQAHPALGVTFGQFRLPLGAAATTLAPQLVMLDRPRYVYAMTKLAFRDVGAMVHSGPAGLLDGALHYRLAVASGSGRLGSGIERPPAATQYLVAGRAMLDAGRVLGGPRDRLVAAVSYARSRDPGIATGTPAGDRALAANTLGRTLVPFGDTRVTHLAGADLTLARGPLWLQGEVMYLRSRATTGGAEASALGFSLEAAYTLPARLPVELQVAARGERFDPDRTVDTDAQTIGALGLNASTPRMRWSAFYAINRFEDGATGGTRHASELAFRAATTF